MNKEHTQQDLIFLQQLLKDSDTFFCDHGTHFIIWAVAIILGQLGTYASIITKSYTLIWPVWAVAVIGGWIASFVASRRESQHSAPSATMYSRLWISIGIIFPVTAVAGIFSGTLSPLALNPIYASVLGLTYFVSAAGTRFRWFTIAAIGWWLGSALLYFVQDANNFLVMAVLMLFFQALPGIMLNRQNHS